MLKNRIEVFEAMFISQNKYGQFLISGQNCMIKSVIICVRDVA